ncbi:hypothetical protein [Streptomyces sp. NBC_01508]|uniref:hypothetical protein n=1 Tax=Streptomyces sp. NBC_01508 TaxID=2903888 RepID=UPI00386EBFF9
MGLILFPGDGDNSSPDVTWSCIRFNDFREQLAQAEGFNLPEMWGFGGDRPWSDISTPLEPLLDHRMSVATASTPPTALRCCPV